MRFKEFKWIPLNQLRVSPENIRKSLVEREKEKLKKSIKKKNVLDALVVYYNENDQVYEIVRGQRRFLAAKELAEEGYPIKELPCLVKEAESPYEATEESLLDELMRQAVEPTDTGKAILELTKKYGTVEKAAEALGVDFQWFDYYVSRLALNPPAKVIEEEEEKPKEEKKITLEAFTEPIIQRKDQLSSLSLEERKEVERRIHEEPKKPLQVVVSEAKEWLENSREVIFRLEEKNYQGLLEWTKEPHKEEEITLTIKVPETKNQITVRRGMDILINALLKAYLKEKKYI